MSSPPRRSRSITRFASILPRLKPRASGNSIGAAALGADAPPTPTPTLTPHPAPALGRSQSLHRFPPRASSAAASESLTQTQTLPDTAAKTKSIEFVSLPIAPASFGNRRRSTNSTNLIPSSSSMSPSSARSTPPGTLFNSDELPTLSRKSGSIGSRKSNSSFEKVHTKLEDEIGGIYGWNQEEADVANREYVEFMKSKGVLVAKVGGTVV
ncbi:hypothetical protein BDR26DRAFT_1009442 [Obelidium mucronatum]|nr:hypothetical protein BDR26DRAFT_1009442 [Obelidium mucronatum]